MTPQVKRLGAIVALLAILFTDGPADSSADGLMQADVGGHPISVEVASTPEGRRVGLMNRERLPDDQGLLMVYPRTQPVKLWMLNTHIPLDAGFFDAHGRLLGVTAMRPDGGKAIHSSPGSALYVLETHLGWFGRHGIKEGDRLRLPHPIMGR